MTYTPRRFYIDRNDDQDETVVRTIAVRRPATPATHKMQSSSLSTSSSKRNHHLPRVGKLVQTAIKRRAS